MGVLSRCSTPKIEIVKKKHANFVDTKISKVLPDFILIVSLCILIVVYVLSMYS